MVGSQYSSKPTFFYYSYTTEKLACKEQDNTVCLLKRKHSVTSILYVFYLLTTKYPKKIVFGTISTERNTTAMNKITTNNQIQRILKYCRENIKSNHARSKATYCRCFLFLNIEKIQCMHRERCTYFYNTCKDCCQRCLLRLETWGPWVAGPAYRQTDSPVQTKVVALLNSSSIE